MSKFVINKPAIDQAKLDAFAAGAESHEAVATAPRSLEPVEPVLPRSSAPAPTAASDLPKSILIRLADSPGLAEKLQEAFQRSTYKSQQRLVVALLNDGLDRLIDQLNR